MLQQRAAFTEDRDNVDDRGGEVAGHEAGQGRVVIGHLNGKCKIAYVFEVA